MIPAVVATPAPHVPQTVQSIQLSEIKDLCSMIRAPVHNQCIGYLCDGDQLHDVLPLPVPGPGLPETETYITLSDIKQDVCQLSTQKRIKLAAILASSLLQLQTTPWLVGSFEKENIFFYRRGQEVCLDHPYVRHAFTPTSSCNTQSEPEIRLATRTSLDNLGILLLELCFGKPIETTKIRERYLVDGKPHQGTDYMTAREWVDSVWEEEPKLESIIKTCLFHPFEEKPDWRNKLFTQAVYVSVVGPLDDYFVTKWP
ncbi:MAG: hypothetical protein CL912_21590 [Deltaproteobacteria bacterium]|nr:hypothetical protein [Deltaproteobacteria bacterium]